MPSSWKRWPTESHQMWLINVFSLIRNGLWCLIMHTCSVLNLDFSGQTCEMKGKQFGAIGMMYDDVAENHWAALVSHGLAETSKLKALRPSSDAYIYIFLFVRTYNTWCIYIYTSLLYMIYDSNPAFCKFCVNSELLTPVEVPSYAMLCLAMVRVIFF